MAASYSRDYQRTSDAFKRNDIMNVLKPQMQGAIEAAKSQRYVIWTTGLSFIGHYDFAKKAFPLNNSFLTDNSTGYFMDNSSYQFYFRNGNAFRDMPVADENVAKQIESMVSHNQFFNIKMYVFAQSADLSNRSVGVVITRTELLDRSGNVLASYQPQ
jgi:hypothetical protein